MFFDGNRETQTKKRRGPSFICALFDVVFFRLQWRTYMQCFSPEIKRHDASMSTNGKRRALLPARVLVFLVLLKCPPAFALLMNLGAVNMSDYPFGANDLHLTLTSTTSIPVLTVTQTSPLGPPVITDGGSKTVSVDWEFIGQPLHKGQGAIIGISIPDPDIHAQAIEVTEFYWTFFGLPIPMGTIPLVNRIIFPGLQSSDRRFAVLRETVYSGPPCSVPTCADPVITGDFWFAGITSMEQPMVENVTQNDIWATTSIGIFDRELTLGELNPTLAGMGPTSPITLFAATAVPEPATWLLLCVAFSSLLVTIKMRKGY